MVGHPSNTVEDGESVARVGDLQLHKVVVGDDVDEVEVVPALGDELCVVLQ